MITIIRVNKEEVTEIRKWFPHEQIVRTCIQKSKRHTYYVTESKGVLDLVRRIREGTYHAQ